MDDTVGRRYSWRRPDAGGSDVATAPTSPDYASANAYANDPVLIACLETALDDTTDEDFKALGAYWGSSDAQEVARLASANRPTLRRTDFEGRRIDQVDIHPASRALLNRSVAYGLASAAWEEGEDRRLHRLRAATLHVTAHCERGHLLPLCATHASVAALEYAPQLEGELFPLIASRRYDRRPLPLEEKEGAIVSVATGQHTIGEGAPLPLRAELGGGERVRISGVVTAVPDPTADMVFVLADTGDGPTAAMVPRYAPENEGAIWVEMLHQTSGFVSQAFATMSFDSAVGRRVGLPGRGLMVLRDVRTLMQLDAVLIAGGAVRAAVGRAAHHARYARLRTHPMITDPAFAHTLADLAIDSAALTALGIRLATAFDLAFERDSDHAVARIVTPAARLFAASLAPRIAVEASELLGPVALNEMHPAARIRADLVALTQWDGVARDAAAELGQLVVRDPKLASAAIDELGADLGAEHAEPLRDAEVMAERVSEDPRLARMFAEQIAMIAAASSMRKHLPRVVADAYIDTRLNGAYRLASGASEPRFDAAAVIDFTLPEG